MNKIKSMLLTFVKPLVLAHIADLSLLSPMLSKVIMGKISIPQADADALAGELVNVIETEITTLINKL